MKGDWMDEARRFEDADKAIMASLERENNYWKRVGGHPSVGYQDTPRVYVCEYENCRTVGFKADDDGTMDQCQQCEAYTCAEHRTMNKACNGEVCVSCREQEEIDAVTPRFED